MDSPVQISVDRCLADSGSLLNIKLQLGAVEINIEMTKEDAELLPLVKHARWDNRRSVRAGICANAPVFWSTSNDELSILVGHDDETWDIGITLPVSVLDTIQSRVAEMIKQFDGFN